MSRSSQARIDQSRRARRAAERRAAQVTRTTSKGRSPVLLISAIVGGLGIVVLGVLILASHSGPAVADTSGLATPAAATPLTLADGRALGKADAPVTLDVATTAWSTSD